jgi:hypothetical protein
MCFTATVIAIAEVTVLQWQQAGQPQLFALLALMKPSSTKHLSTRLLHLW